MMKGNEIVGILKLPGLPSIWLDMFFCLVYHIWYHTPAPPSFQLRLFGLLYLVIYIRYFDPSPFRPLSPYGLLHSPPPFAFKDTPAPRKSQPFGFSAGVLARPLARHLVVPALVRLEQVRDLRHERIVRVGVCQEGGEGEEHLCVIGWDVIGMMNLLVLSSQFESRTLIDGPWTRSARGSTET